MSLLTIKYPVTDVPSYAKLTNRLVTIMSHDSYDIVYLI